MDSAFVSAAASVISATAAWGAIGFGLYQLQKQQEAFRNSIRSERLQAIADQMDRALAELEALIENPIVNVTDMTQKSTLTIERDTKIETAKSVLLGAIRDLPLDIDNSKANQILEDFDSKKHTNFDVISKFFSDASAKAKNASNDLLGGKK